MEPVIVCAVTKEVVRINTAKATAAKTKKRTRTDFIPASKTKLGKASTDARCVADTANANVCGPAYAPSRALWGEHTVFLLWNGCQEKFTIFQSSRRVEKLHLFPSLWISRKD